MSDFLYIQTILLASAGLGLLALDWSRRRTVRQRLLAVIGAAPEQAARHTWIAGLQWLGARAPGASDGTLRACLAKAGYFHPAALPVFVALRLLCTATIFFAALFKDGATPAPLTLSLAIFLAFFCSRLFVIVVKMRGEARQHVIRRELPPVVDVLLMVLNSGVSIDQGLRYAADLVAGTAPLVTEVLHRYIAEIDGGVPYETAFERMGQRFGIDEGYDLAALIKQSLMQGGEILGSLERFGEEVSEKRVAHAREQIGRKSILLTIVMLFFFMPVLLIILAGPAVSDILSTLSTVKQQIHLKELKR
jgi:tight adherence protein C